jgi:flagellar FliL protein
MNYSVFSRLRRLAISIFISAALPAFAGDHGGGAGGGGEPLQFTVNIGSSTSATRFLQVTMVFEFASPAAAARLALLKPKAQHRVILRLTHADVASLQTAKGKLALQEQITSDLNALLDETPKTGVKEVLFTSFIIQ